MITGHLTPYPSRTKRSANPPLVSIVHKRGSGKLRRAAREVHLRQVDGKRPNHRCASSVVHKSGCGRSAADYSPRFLPTDGQIGMYGPPLQRCMSAKSTSIAQAAPQRRELPRQSAHAVVRKSAHQLRTLVAAGIDSRAHLTRVLAQHCAHGGADRPRSLNLKRVSPCHSSCPDPCAQFGNNRVYGTTVVHGTAARPSNPRTTAEYIPAPNRTTGRTTQASRRTSVRNSPAHSRAIARTPNRNKYTTETRIASARLHTAHRSSVRECHNSSVVFRRLSISTGYSQPITAALSAGCKGSIHANSTPIPLQTNGNR